MAGGLRQQLEVVNRRLNCLVVDQALDIQVQKEVMNQKNQGRRLVLLREAIRLGVRAVHIRQHPIA